MRIATIILPTHDNAGASLGAEADALRNMLLDSFGGFTESDTRGAWRDPATRKVYVEPSTRFDIACEDSARTRVALLDIARHMARVARQECIFLAYPSGEVDFISAQPAQFVASPGGM
jgi:hypothetical protein